MGTGRAATSSVVTPSSVIILSTSLFERPLAAGVGRRLRIGEAPHATLRVEVVDVDVARRAVRQQACAC